MDVLSALRAARLVPVVVLAGSRQSRVSAGQQQFDRSVWVAGVMSGRCGDAGFPGQA